MLSNWINALENVNYIRHHHQKSQNAPQIAFGKHAQNNTVSTHRGIGKRLSWVNGWCIPRKGTRKEDTQERERAKKRDRRKRQKVNVVNKHIRINAPKDLKTARSCRKQPSLWMFAYAWHLFSLCTVKWNALRKNCVYWFSVRTAIFLWTLNNIAHQQQNLATCIQFVVIFLFSIQRIEYEPIFFSRKNNQK